MPQSDHMPAGGVRSQRGTAFTCRGWQQEGAFRMLDNNLDAEVAGRPEDLTRTAGLGGMGGAQPLAVRMNDGVARGLRTPMLEG